MNVDDIKLAGKKQNLNPIWKVFNKEVDLGEETSLLDHVYLGCTQRQCEISKDVLWTITGPCSIREFQRGEQKNFHSLKNFVFLRGPVTWRVMPGNEWNDIVS